MANKENLVRLRTEVGGWNAWREEHPDIVPDLLGADLQAANLQGSNLEGADLRGADLSIVNLRKADLKGADLRKADLQGANLQGSNLHGADLRGATLLMANLEEAHLLKAKLRLTKLSMAHLSRTNLRKMDLRGADLSGANLSNANLYKADLRGVHFVTANFSGAYLTSANLTAARLDRANLSGAILIQTNLTGADLTGCRVYGISAWDLKLEGAKQRNLVITKDNEPEITVDNIEVGQFIYLLLHNKKIRDVIDTITSKVVLILGSFTPPERKAVLNALRNILPEQDRTPVVFDFDAPSTKNVTDTVKLLAQLARYIIVDLSDPNSAPYELGVISMLGLKTTAVVPIIVSDQKPFPMLKDVLQERWSTDLVTYQDLNDLITNLGEKRGCPEPC